MLLFLGPTAQLRTVTAVPLMVLAATEAQVETKEISAVPPAGGVPKVIAVSHGIASAVSYEADGSKLWATEEPEEM